MLHALQRGTLALQRLGAAQASTVQQIVMATWSVLHQHQHALEMGIPAQQRLAAALASTVRPIVMAIWSVLLDPMMEGGEEGQYLLRMEVFMPTIWLYQH